MPAVISVLRQSQLIDTSTYRTANRATTRMQECGCLTFWNEYHRRSVEGKGSELSVNRLRLCIEEQVWTEGDISGISLTANDRTEPYPDVVNRCLANKLRNARALKKELFESIGEQRRLLIDRHRSCYE